MNEQNNALVDRARALLAECQSETTDVTIATERKFIAAARYLATDGQDLTADACLSSNRCSWVLRIPEPRRDLP